VVWYHTGNPFQWVDIQRIGWGKTAADFGLFWKHVEQLPQLGLLGYVERSPVDALNLAGAVRAVRSGRSLAAGRSGVLSP
jgi:hypothetical protein